MTAAVDGRTARSERTRTRIVAATIDLIVQHDAAPTSRQIAHRAGVAERTLYLHFPDLESLHAAVAEHHFVTVTASRRPIRPELPLDERIATFTRRRAQVLEAIGPVRRVGLRFEHDSPALRSSRRRWTASARRDLAQTFGRELDDPVILAAAQALTSWAAWDEWRSAQGLSRRAAAQAMRLALHRLLDR